MTGEDLNTYYRGLDQELNNQETLATIEDEHVGHLVS